MVDQTDAKFSIASPSRSLVVRIGTVQIDGNILFLAIATRKQVEAPIEVKEIKGKERYIDMLSPSSLKLRITRVS